MVHIEARSIRVACVFSLVFALAGVLTPLLPAFGLSGQGSSHTAAKPSEKSISISGTARLPRNRATSNVSI